MCHIAQLSQLNSLLSLLRSETSYLSGQLLAKKTGVSRSAVWKQLKMLRRYGYAIESRHGLGYKLSGQTDLPVPWELTNVLRTLFIGRNIVYRQSADSTQNIAILLASKSDYHGTVVIAEQQTNGRGRQKRKWVSPKGGIWLSVVLNPRIPTSKITLLPFAAALAVYDAIRETGVVPGMKWPNDIMISGKKVAGVLVDISAEADQVNYAVIGIGINANISSAIISASIEGIKITSLSEELGHNVSRLALTKVLLENLERYYVELEQRGPTRILQMWKKNSGFLGHKVILTQGDNTIHGVATDINDDGSLLVRTNNRLISVVSGDVRVRY